MNGGLRPSANGREGSSRGRPVSKMACIDRVAKEASCSPIRCRWRSHLSHRYCVSQALSWSPWSRAHPSGRRRLSDRLCIQFHGVADVDLCQNSSRRTGAPTDGALPPARWRQSRLGAVDRRGTVFGRCQLPRCEARSWGSERRWQLCCVSPLDLRRAACPVVSGAARQRELRGPHCSGARPHLDGRPVRS